MLPEWRRRAIQHLCEEGDAELVLVIRRSDLRRGQIHGSDVDMTLRWYLAKWVDRTCALRRQVDISDLTAGLPCLDCRLPASEYRHAVSQFLASIGRHELDFILDCTTGNGSDALSSCARYGLWRFTDGNAPLDDHPFLAALCHPTPTIFCALEQLTDAARVPNLLFHGHLRKTDWSYVATLRRALDQAARWPMLTAKRIVLNGTPAVTSRPTPNSSGQIGSRPTMRQLITRTGSSLLRRVWNEIFRADSWNVGVVELSVRDLIEGKTRPVRWLPPHRFGCYIADPFIHRTEPLVTCLVEDFSHFRRGRISEAVIRPVGRQLQLTTVLERDYHLSYPHLVRRGEDTFCLPESQENGDLTLYRWEEDRLIPIWPIIAGHRIADATTFQYGAHHWLFCGLEDGHAMTNLSIFFAHDLLGPWQPHPLNPVKTDVASSRPAGNVFSVGGDLYRPAQNCSTTYGGGIWINRIDVLTTTSFAETPLIELGPCANSPYDRGIHTLNIGDGFIVIDGKGRTGPMASFLSLPFRLWRRACRRRAPVKLDTVKPLKSMRENSEVS